MFLAVPLLFITDHSFLRLNFSMVEQYASINCFKDFHEKKVFEEPNKIRTHPLKYVD